MEALAARYNTAALSSKQQQEEMQHLVMETADRRFTEHIAKLQQDKLEEVTESDDEKPDDDEDDYYDDEEEEPKKCPVS